MKIVSAYARAIFICSVISLLLAAAGCGSTSGRGGQTGGSTGETGKSTAGRADPDAKNWNIALLDTAANVSYLTGAEKDVILEQNKVRTNPRKYAQLYLQPMLKYFNGKIYAEPGKGNLITQEGAAAVTECIATLNNIAPVGILIPEKGLSRAAKDHANEMSKTGKLSHDSSDKSGPDTRMKRYGSFSGYWNFGENVCYGSSTGRDIISQLLIDDGVPGRGHLKNIMNMTFTQAGVGIAPHPRYSAFCAIDSAVGYTSK